ncbi:hypothetical protein [Mycobacterium sp.]|uniref:hypothetical protein n=1 Tax=Mycobacterium sp. TaxID=1785 RepID=UPI003F97877A
MSIAERSPASGAGVQRDRTGLTSRRTARRCVDPHNDLRASLTYHHTPAAALAAAPTDAPFTVVNIAVAATRPYPSIDELIGRRRFLSNPYPGHGGRPAGRYRGLLP